jgi:hypothetical protein
MNENERIWVNEAVRHWRESSDDRDERPKPLDLSVIQRLFDACNPRHPDYDADFHRQLYREKPHFFGPGGLSKPET